MSATIREILQSKRKPEEKVSLLTEYFKRDNELFNDLIEVFKQARMLKKASVRR